MLIRRFSAVAIGIINDVTDSSNTANIAWTYGQSQCTFEFLSYQPDNPCEQEFALTDGLESFQLAGCGDGLWMNKNGAFWGNCEYLPLSLGWCKDPTNTLYGGNVAQTYVCFT
jgi:hypothetical protein